MKMQSPAHPRLNGRIVLAARPQGAPRATDFRYETVAIPSPDPEQVLVRTEFLSLDPYMRNVMDEIAPTYAASIQLGDVIVGASVGRVIASKHPGFREGDRVLGNGGWQEYWVANGADLTPLGAMSRPSLALGALGMPAFTAHVGLLDIGQPQAGETVVVAAATGAVGSNVGQIAKIKGARVVGIAGGADKCRYAVEELGFDVCIDRRDPRFALLLADACPNGIDVYFENVGGEVLDAVVPLLNVGARIPVCGYIAHYNDAVPQGTNRLPPLLSAVLQKRVRMQGFIILDHYGPRYDAFLSEMQEWLANGRIKTREHLVDGLRNAPAAFADLLEGRNFGKVVVRIA
jgi:NADPH-dependent curcumin reductase CurA